MNIENFPNGDELVNTKTLSKFIGFEKEFWHKHRKFAFDSKIGPLPYVLSGNKDKNKGSIYLFPFEKVMKWIENWIYERTNKPIMPLNTTKINSYLKVLAKIEIYKKEKGLPLGENEILIDLLKALPLKTSNVKSKSNYKYIPPKQLLDEELMEIKNVHPTEIPNKNETYSFEGIIKLMEDKIEKIKEAIEKIKEIKI